MDSAIQAKGGFVALVVFSFFLEYFSGYQWQAVVTVIAVHMLQLDVLSGIARAVCYLLVSQCRCLAGV